MESNLRVNYVKVRPDLRIKLFDRSPRVLRDFPERLSKYVQKWFDTNNVDVVSNQTLQK